MQKWMKAKIIFYINLNKYWLYYTMIKSPSLFKNELNLQENSNKVGGSGWI